MVHRLDEPALIAWKTDAWKSPQMVAGYAARMNDRSGGVTVKNLVETTLVADGVRGETLLDVGIGTGRASLPLARAGMQVTGVDSSEAMLAQTRALAGDTPIELRTADVAALPFADESFDSVCSLNTLTHFPHWDRALAEFARVARPGGRIVFDLYSLDHDAEVLRARGESPAAAAERFAAATFSDFLSRASLAELAAAADRLGLTVVRVAPYGALFGLPTLNRWVPALVTASFDRLVSYANRFPALLELCRVLELDVLAHLDVTASGRFMVTFEKRADPAANAAFLAADAAKRAALAGGLDGGALAACGVDVPALAAALTRLLRFPPNRIFAYRVLLPAVQARYRVALAELAGGEAADALLELIGRRLDDDRIAALSAAIVDRLGDALTYRGVPVAAGARYELGRRVLDEALHRFPSDAPR